MVQTGRLTLTPDLLLEQIEERYGAVNWDPNVKTTYCYQCVEVSVESTGMLRVFVNKTMGQLRFVVQSTV
jgi:hypothetical protein